MMFRSLWRVWLTALLFLAVLGGNLIAIQPSDPAPAQAQGVTVPSETAKPVATAVVNFADLARAEAQRGVAPRQPKPYRPRLSAPEPVESTAPPAESERTRAPAAPNVSSPSPALTFQGFFDTNITIPPDTMGAVGPNHVMTTLNDSYRIHNRTGGTLSTVLMDSFWASVLPGGSTGSFDPKTVYDPYSQRWILAAASDGQNSNSSILIGVSQTNDPTGSFFLARFDADATNLLWADYPSLGFNQTWIAISYNMFAVAGNAFSGSKLYMFDYASAKSGTFTASTQMTGNTIFTLQPVVTFSSSQTTLYVVNHNSSGGANYRLSTITGTAASPTFTLGGLQTNSLGAWTQPDISGGNIEPQAAGSGTGSTPNVKIDSGDARVLNAVFRNNFIYYAQTIGLPSGGTVTRTAAQWVKITTAGLFSDGGRIDDSTATSTNGGKWYAFPTISVNANDDILVGFSQFSSAQWASAGYTYHDHTDAAGTMRDPVIYRAGQDYYSKDFSSGDCRWGDYSMTVVDPVDDLTFWTIQEAAGLRDGTTPFTDSDSRWDTWWAKVSPVATPTPTATSTRTSTATNTPTRTSTATSTPTVTNTATRTSTATNTPTITNTPIATNTPTSTSTPTNTPSNTATTTRTPTQTNTATATTTPSQTPTTTLTPTLTSTATGTTTATRTPTASSTATNTPPAPPTATATATTTQSATATSTATATATATAPAGLGNLKLLTDPVRVIDTRGAPFTTGFDQNGAPITPGAFNNGETRRFKIAGKTFGSTAVPADAAGVLINVSIVQPITAGTGGYTIVFPGDQSAPVAATVNPIDPIPAGLAIAVNQNFSIVGLAPVSGTLGVASFGDPLVRDVVVDLVGYFAPSNPNSTGPITFIAPVRVLDTRGGGLTIGFDGATGNPIAPGTPPTGQINRYRLANKSFGSLAQGNQITFPATITGILAHITTVQTPGQGGYTTLLPGDATLPVGTATLNPVNAISFNSWANSIPTAGPNAGNFGVYGLIAQDVIVDIFGYTATTNPTTLGALSLVNPLRVVDTRGAPFTTGYDENGTPITPAPFPPADTTRRYRLNGQVFGGTPLPGDLRGALMNVSIVSPPGVAPTGGYTTVYPGDAAVAPGAATVNPTYTVSGSFWGSGIPNPPSLFPGTLAAFSTGNTRDLIIDVTGYFR